MNMMPVVATLVSGLATLAFPDRAFAQEDAEHKNEGQTLAGQTCFETGTHVDSIGLHIGVCKALIIDAIADTGSEIYHPFGFDFGVHGNIIETDNFNLIVGTGLFTMVVPTDIGLFTFLHAGEINVFLGNEKIGIGGDFLFNVQEGDLEEWRTYASFMNTFAIGINSQPLHIHDVGRFLENLPNQVDSEHEHESVNSLFGVLVPHENVSIGFLLAPEGVAVSVGFSYTFELFPDDEHGEEEHHADPLLPHIHFMY